MLVRNLLSKKTYVGMIEFNGRVYRGIHEPIVDSETFERAQEMIRGRSENYRSSSTFLLTGLLRCGCCGAKMRNQKWGNAGYRIYCYSRQKSKKYLVKNPLCPSQIYDAQEVEKRVVEAMKLRRFDRSQSAQSELKKVLPMDEIERRIRVEKSRLKRLYAIYSDGDDTMMELILEEKELIQKLEQRMAVEKAMQEENSSRVQLERIDSLLGVWEDLSAQDQREIAVEWIAAVYVSPDGIRVDFRF